VADGKPAYVRIGFTRGKALLIGALAIVLVLLIYTQYGPGRLEDTSTGAVHLSPPQASARVPVPTPSSPPEKKPPVADDTSQPANAAFDESRWIPPPLTTVISYDPFALPPLFPRPIEVSRGTAATSAVDSNSAEHRDGQLARAVERFQRQLEELKQRGVHVIIGRRNQYLAVIGDRTLQVGDEINGFKVTAIDADGVHVEKTSVE